GGQNGAAIADRRSGPGRSTLQACARWGRGSRPGRQKPGCAARRRRRRADHWQPARALQMAERRGSPDFAESRLVVQLRFAVERRAPPGSAESRAVAAPRFVVEPRFVVGQLVVERRCGKRAWTAQLRRRRPERVAATDFAADSVGPLSHRHGRRQCGRSLAAAARERSAPSARGAPWPKLHRRKDARDAAAQYEALALRAARTGPPG